jgi:hypothetical protein
MAPTVSDISAKLDSFTMAHSMTLPIKLSPELTPREAIMDALHRSSIGMDTNDVELFDSAYAKNTRWDLNGKIIDGLEEVHTKCYNPTISNLDTTHHFTNIRINIADNQHEAAMSAIFLAQHWRLGEGKIPGSLRYTTGGHVYLEFTKDEEEGVWKIKFYRTKSIWFEGHRKEVMGHD